MMINCRLHTRGQSDPISRCLLLVFGFHHTYDMVLYVVSLYPYLLHSPQSLYNIVATILCMCITILLPLYDYTEGYNGCSMYTRIRDTSQTSALVSNKGV